MTPGLKGVVNGLPRRESSYCSPWAVVAACARLNRVRPQTLGRSLGCHRWEVLVEGRFRPDRLDGLVPRASWRPRAHFFGTAPAVGQYLMSQQYCRSCLRFGFDCELYRFAALTHCPIHQEPWLTHCPVCSRALADGLSTQVGLACHGCSFSFVDEALLRSAKLAPSQLEALETAVQRVRRAFLELRLPERALFVHLPTSKRAAAQTLMAVCDEGPPSVCLQVAGLTESVERNPRRLGDVRWKYYPTTRQAALEVYLWTRRRALREVGARIGRLHAFRRAAERGARSRQLPTANLVADPMCAAFIAFRETWEAPDSDHLLFVSAPSRKTLGMQLWRQVVARCPVACRSAKRVPWAAARLFATVFSASWKALLALHLGQPVLAECPLWLRASARSDCRELWRLRLGAAEPEPECPAKSPSPFQTYLLDQHHLRHGHC